MGTYKRAIQPAIEANLYNQNRRHRVNRYFWRTYDGQEIDYLEEAGGQLVAFECKWSKTEQRVPPAFAKTYPDNTFHVAHPQNYLDFLIEEQGWFTI